MLAHREPPRPKLGFGTFVPSYAVVVIVVFIGQFREHSVLLSVLRHIYEHSAALKEQYRK